MGRGLRRLAGVSRRTLDLTATALSGVLRFIIIVVVGLIVFMPWGLEYGDVNPFADFSTFVTTSDLRNWLGSFGFGLLAFVVGLLGTRLIVGWLNSALLPRMSLDSGIRHSIRTVLGYVGFAATAFVALSLMGVNTQNVAVVAGALSVGIGFGLQLIRLELRFGTGPSRRAPRTRRRRCRREWGRGTGRADQRPRHANRNAGKVHFDRSQFGTDHDDGS